MPELKRLPDAKEHSGVVENDASARLSEEVHTDITRTSSTASKAKPDGRQDLDPGAKGRFDQEAASDFVIVLESAEQ